MAANTPGDRDIDIEKCSIVRISCGDATAVNFCGRKRTQGFTLSSGALFLSKVGSRLFNPIYNGGMVTSTGTTI